MNILSRFKHIKYFILDMDGVLTDGSLYIHPDGEWTRKMNIKDGYALQLAIKSGYKILVISGSESKPVSERLNKLGITEVYMKITEKEKFLKEYIVKNNWSFEEMLGMGDDVPDYNFMQITGLACCPINASDDIKKISAYISPFKGGEGCVRDVIEKVLKLNHHWSIDTSVTSS